MLTLGPRTIAIILAAALALGSAVSPASARFFNRNNHGSITFPPQTSRSEAVSNLRSNTGSFDWAELAIGASATALALAALGATLTSRPRRRSTPGRSTTSA